MKPKVRIPKQKRSIEKKNNIIKSAYELFNTEGYFKTDTTLIAKHAGVATGTIYCYFLDKKSILYEVIDLYFNNLKAKLILSFNDIQYKDLNEVVNFLIYSFIGNISSSKKLRRELIAVSSTDIEIDEFYINKKIEMINTLSSLLQDISINFRYQEADSLFLYDVLEMIADQFTNPTICSKMSKSQLISEATITIRSLLISYIKV